MSQELTLSLAALGAVLGVINLIVILLNRKGM